MKVKKYEETVNLPEGVNASLEGENLILKGPKGEVSKRFRDIFVKIQPSESDIKIFAENATKRQKRIIGTFKSHIKNMVTGVTEGYTYKLRICSGHFPMTVTANNGEIVVKNFIGEKVPRVLKIKTGADVKIEGTDITITALDKETAGQVAADIEQLTKRRGFDSRVFQAGIYMIEKAGKEIKIQ